MQQEDLLALTRRAAHQPKDMYLECAFDGQHQNPCDVRREVSWARTREGFCYTINSHQVQARYEEKMTTRPGGDFGLYLLINVEQYDHLFSLGNVSGVQVLVYDPHVLPDVSEMGLVASPGTKVHVAAKKPVLKRLPEPYAKPPYLCEESHQPSYRNPCSSSLSTVCLRADVSAASITSCQNVAHLTPTVGKMS